MPPNMFDFCNLWMDISPQHDSLQMCSLGVHLLVDNCVYQHCATLTTCHSQCSCSTMHSFGLHAPSVGELTNIGNPSTLLTKCMHESSEGLSSTCMQWY